jgi:2-polyprenyl-3-methyl-5-hydroxy-6-metoxy-1,4-benzoquinol methylase
MRNYGIKANYQSRICVPHFDDTPFTDEFQADVYQYAARVPCKSVLDVGCGSGFKLLKHFADRLTIGFELEPTLTWLRAKYPQRLWLDPAQSGGYLLGPHPRLAICADVIEHVQDPDALLQFIASLHADVIVFSTPDRERLALGTENGPPRNVHHVREWTQAEFSAYVGESFKVLEALGGTTVTLKCAKK